VPVVPSQTLNGYTVSLYPVSADATNVVLGYSITGPPNSDATVCIQNPRLSINQMTATLGGSVTPCKALSAASTDDANSGATLIFATMKQVDGQTRFKLDLSLNIYPTQDTVPNASTTVARSVGPFHFEFSMPFDSSRRLIAVGRTIDTHGVAITLERIIITASETRLYFSYRSPSGAPLPSQWYPILSLQAGDWSSDREGKDVETDRQQQDPQHLVYTIHTSLAAHQGEWALLIPELQRDNGAQHLLGPWEFHFTISDGATILP
jgi:hypothetical protein